MIINLPNGNSYYLESPLIQKLDLMINRMSGKNKDDNLILIDGDEGQGKTNLESAIAGYVHVKTKRNLTLANMFFDLDELINFAINTKEQIILWDEGALGGLAIEWWKKNQIKFIKMLMVARKKKHFMIICIPKFFKLNEYLVVDRSIALLRVYSKNNLQKGRYMYFNKFAKEALYNDWKKSKRRSYLKYMTFGGSFPEALPKVFDEVEYNKKKDKAILSISDDGTADKWKQKFEEFESKVAFFIREHKLVDAFAEWIGLHERTIRRKASKHKKNEENQGTGLSWAEGNGHNYYFKGIKKGDSCKQ